MKNRFSDRVTYEVVEQVGIISLSRPEKMNAFDAAMYRGFNEALTAFRDDDGARVGIVQAEGERAFSVGADVNALNENAARGITTGLGSLLLDSGMVTDKPLIAAVHGHCVGEAVNLVLGCDMVFADASANFMISEVRLGVNPVDIPIKLAARIGYARAFAFLNPGDGKDADWAARAGLVERVCPRGTVQQEALAFARRLATECAPLALRAQKATLWTASFGQPATAKIIGEARRQKIRQSEDYAEGRRAFLEKRPPQFSGS